MKIIIVILNSKYKIKKTRKIANFKTIKNTPQKA